MRQTCASCRRPRYEAWVGQARSAGRGRRRRLGRRRGGGGGQTASAEGEQVFNANGCGSCHTLEAADASGNVGPDLDKIAKARRRPTSSSRSPSRAPWWSTGFADGIMPQNFAAKLSPCRARRAREVPSGGASNDVCSPTGCIAPGWYRAVLGVLAGIRLRHGHRGARPLAVRLRADRRLGRDRHGRRPDRSAARLPGRASAASTTGSAGPRARPPSPRTTRATAPTRGRTTSASTPTTRSSASSTSAPRSSSSSPAA